MLVKGATESEKNGMGGGGGSLYHSDKQWSEIEQNIVSIESDDTGSARWWNEYLISKWKNMCWF